MGGWLSRQWAEHRHGIVVTVFLVVLLLGAVGWSKSDESLSWLDVLYNALRLFVIEYDPVPHPHWALEIARFGAFAVASWAVGALALRVLKARSTLSRAVRTVGHVVIIGAGREVSTAAARFADRDCRVVAITTDEDLTERRRLESNPVFLIGLTNVELGRVLRKASRIIVAEPDDLTALTTTRRVLGSKDDATPVVTVFNDPDLASLWERTGGCETVCRTTVVASALLRGTPPQPTNATAPPPVVVGDGPFAAELARLISLGWHDPGERWLIDCVGPNQGWVNEARIGGEMRATFRWSEARLHPVIVPRVVAGLARDWPRPQKPERHTITGPRVYVVPEEITRALPIADAVAQLLPQAIVVAVTQDGITWREHDLPDNLVVASELRAGADPDLLCAGRTQPIMEELLAEVDRWPDDEPTLLGVAGSSSESATSRAQAIATQAFEILAEVGIEARSGVVVAAPSVMLGPEELRIVAGRLLSAVGLSSKPLTSVEEPGPDRIFLRALELAERLPALVSRAGLTPLRAKGDPGLDEQTIDTLAQWTHFGYNVVADETGNATTSETAGKSWEELAEVERMSNVAQILSIPLKLAVVGLAWERSDSTDRFEFSEEDLELLAELEHRRFIHFQLRVGRPGHQWNVPWGQLTDDVKEYDRAAVRTIPERLAALGWRVHAAG